MIWSVKPRHWIRQGPLDFHSAHVRAPLALLLAASLVGASLAETPSARAATCDVPFSTSDTTTSIGSVIIQIESTEEATPASLPAATPPGATPIAADPAALLLDELTAVSESLAACLTSGDDEAVTQLAAERYLGQLFGSSVPLSREDYLAISAELSPVPTRIVRLDGVERLNYDQAKATVTQVVGNQLQRAEWTFEQAGSNGWTLAFERQLPVDVPAGAASIAVEIRDVSYALEPATVKGPDVILRGANVASEDHEMLVIKMADGFTTADFLRESGPDLPDDVTFIGEIPVRAGREQDLVLVDLDPGVYTIVCLFLDAEGMPFLVNGMEAAFTVT